MDDSSSCVVWFGVCWFPPFQGFGLKVPEPEALVFLLEIAICLTMEGDGRLGILDYGHTAARCSGA